MQELPKHYDHQAAQARCRGIWDAGRYWHAEAPAPGDRGHAKIFSIVIPPPNVTGALHLGHALNNTLQDILVRSRRMQGYLTLWMPGTDHAGIATQAVVERRLLEEEKLSRHDLGREALVGRIWAWKEQYEKRILGQLRDLGASCDWDRTRFTLDEQCAAAVREAFFRLFQKGLVRRGKRLVNWDTFLQTAVSDDEVFHEEVKGHFWHIRYDVIDPAPGEPTSVTVATTRPETLLGDTAVAVHPDPAAALAAAEQALREKRAALPAKEQAAADAELENLAARRRDLLPLLQTLTAMAKAGRQVRLPLLGRAIPLVADEWAKPEMGSGCVKITPAHDPNDYDVGRRQSLPMVNILNPDGTLNAEAGPYQGLTIKKAREKVVADLEAAGQLEQVEDRLIDLAHSDRSKTPIEPYLADQWFIRMDELAQPALDAVTQGRVRIVPERYAKSYLDWLSEKRDWPVSRQLWWGHRIPIWHVTGVGEADLTAAFGGRGTIAWKPDDAGGWFVCSSDETLPTETVAGKTLERDPDVLDTWFSSALWPHSTLGWPAATPDLAAFYPTSALVTSRDILTLWVARMVIMGLFDVGEIPFQLVSRWSPHGRKATAHYDSVLWRYGMSSVAEKRRALAELAADRHREGRTSRLLKWAAAGGLLLVLLALPVLWALGFFSTPPAVAEMRRLVDEQVAELDRVARGEVPYDTSPGMGAVFEKMREVPRNHRPQVERDLGRLWEARERAETGSYFSLSPEQREAELDRRIRAEEERRRQWEAERAQREAQASGGGQRTGGGTNGGQTGGAPPRSTSDEARLARSKQRIDGTTPDERARRAEYRRAIDERRERMGLPNGGPRRSG